MGKIKNAFRETILLNAAFEEGNAVVCEVCNKLVYCDEAELVEHRGEIYEIHHECQDDFDDDVELGRQMAQQSMYYA